jgi:neutral ceramidase
MKVGISQVDITPAPGGELSGFAVRTQPSLGVLDPLFAKALYLEDEGERLLWMHCDLIGFTPEFVASFRRRISERLGLEESRVMLSATHTHSGPCTVRLRECGQHDPAYEEQLLPRLCEAARLALSRPESCRVVAVEAPIELAVDRRRQPSAHTDPRVAAVGFRRDDGTWASLLVNYAIHPVALGPANRQISADLHGQAAAALTNEMPGRPLVLMTNGACGNLNPPAVGVTPGQVSRWGREIAHAISGRLNAASAGASQHLRVRSRQVPLPLDIMRGAELDAYVERSLQSAGFRKAWGERFQRAVEHWHRSLRETGADLCSPSMREVELMAVEIGETILLGVNAEVFSRFAADVRRAVGRPIYIVGYANGVLGYLPTAAAYTEGGYEVEAAHFFYGGLRYLTGALEKLTNEAVALIRSWRQASRTVTIQTTQMNSLKGGAS